MVYGNLRNFVNFLYAKFCVCERCKKIERSCTTRVANPGSVAFLSPGSGLSFVWIPDPQSGSNFFFHACLERNNFQFCEIYGY